MNQYPRLELARQIREKYPAIDVILTSGAARAVVFTDVQMPGVMDGLMLARWVQEHHPSVQVLVTSGKGDADISSGLMPDDAFYSKPYSLEAVADRIRSLLEQ
jgi:DNA-binding NarL/FixJ family response regulator